MICSIQNISKPFPRLSSRPPCSPTLSYPGANRSWRNVRMRQAMLKRKRYNGVSGDMMDKTFSIQQVADRTGLSIHTLRYYEQIGLLVSIYRLPNGHRRYSEANIRWIAFIKCLRAAGMPLVEI